MLRRVARKFVDAMHDVCWQIGVPLAMRCETAGNTYQRRVRAMHRLLRVPKDYVFRGLPFCREATELVSVDCAADGQRMMTAATRDCLMAMQAAAHCCGVSLQVRSAFRSVDEQVQLLRDELANGKSIDCLLNWIAAPGYSEHHTGCALDFESSPESADFDQTVAFAWLLEHAGDFGFILSYPRENQFGIIYEPWHWLCVEAQK